MISRAATDVLAAVQKAMAKGSTTTVTITGHSLGEISCHLGCLSVIECWRRCCYCLARFSVPPSASSVRNQFQNRRIRSSSGTPLLKSNPEPMSHTQIQVGNQDFADYVDQNLHLTHIVNQEDPGKPMLWKRSSRNSPTLFLKCQSSLADFWVTIIRGK